MKKARMFCGVGEGIVTPPHSCTKEQEALVPGRQYSEDEIISDLFAETCWSRDIDYSQPLEIRRQQYRALMEREQRGKEVRG